MTTIRLFADDQKLRVAHDGPCVVSGSRNATMLHVQFGRGWSDYEKSAVFYTTRDDKVYEVLLDEGKCTIPHEVLSLTADLYIGVRGVSSEHQKVKPTSLVKYKIEKGAPVGDGATVEPTPDVYQQILMRLNDLEVGAGGEVDPVRVTQIVKDYLAEHPGPKGDKGDPGEPGRDGVDGKDGADGKSAYQYAQEAGYTGTEAEFAQDLATDNIPAPATAQVGQTIVVKEVDEYGKPVSWECVDVASGAGTTSDEKWELIADISMTEVVDTLSQTWADTPMRKIRINLITVAAETATNYMSVAIATDNSSSFTMNAGRFYVTPLPTTSAQNYEYFAEIFKLGDDVAMHFTESSGGIIPKGTTSIWRGIINGNTGVKSVVSLGNGLYGRALSEQVTGVSFSTYGTFAEGTKMTIWGVRA